MANLAELYDQRPLSEKLQRPRSAAIDIILGEHEKSPDSDHLNSLKLLSRYLKRVSDARLAAEPDEGKKTAIKDALKVSAVHIGNIKQCLEDFALLHEEAKDIGKREDLNKRGTHDLSEAVTALIQHAATSPLKAPFIEVFLPMPRCCPTAHH